MLVGMVCALGAGLRRDEAARGRRLGATRPWNSFRTRPSPQAYTSEQKPLPIRAAVPGLSSGMTPSPRRMYQASVGIAAHVRAPLRLPADIDFSAPPAYPFNFTQPGDPTRKDRADEQFG